MIESMDFLSEYFIVVIVGVCLCTGYIIKKSLPMINNSYIPLLMGVLGLVLNVWIHNFSISPEIILGGLFSGLASTGLHQAFTRLLDELGGNKNA